jgi:CRISPR-associated endonuclease Cas2
MRFSKINKVILNSLYIAGFVSVALVAPNALQLFDPKKRPRMDSMRRAFSRLKSSGYIEVVDQKARLTQKGKILLNRLTYLGYGETKKWDKKWRVIIFDIPEKRRVVRDQLRQTLNTIGFVKLQNSVWVYPYECSELISLLKSDFKIGKDLLYLTVFEIENDQFLRKYYKLENN